MQADAYDGYNELYAASWLFAGSERGADRAAAMATLIMTAKPNDIDPLAWLADVLARILQGRLHELLPWEWKRTASNPAAAGCAIFWRGIGVPHPNEPGWRHDANHRRLAGSAAVSASAVSAWLPAG